jgi:hypothetical protein
MRRDGGPYLPARPALLLPKGQYEFCLSQSPAGFAGSHWLSSRSYRLEHLFR